MNLIIHSFLNLGREQERQPPRQENGHRQYRDHRDRDAGGWGDDRRNGSNG